VEISLIICTRNRAKQLKATLEACRRLQLSSAHELVIVDNGSTDGTGAVLEDFRRSYSGNLRLEDEPQPGLARARNRGWRTATGRILAFTDDDCYPAEDFLCAIAECFQEQELGFVGGRVLLFDPEDAHIAIQPCEDRADFEPGSYMRPGVIHGANFAFAREALEVIGGFDERFGAGTNLFSAEDTDAMARVLGAGWRGAYDPRPLVYHHHGRRDPLEIRRLQRGYRIGAGAYHLKCLLNPRLTLRYASGWARFLLRQPLKGVAWELQGALKYLAA
jgi:glycosyltransferase involved in cell wall biosynthesis